MKYSTFKYPLPSSARFADFAKGSCGLLRLLLHFDKQHLKKI